MYSFQASSAGHKDIEAVSFLEKKVKNDPSLSFQEAVQVPVGVFFLI
jgi:20S proteasome subunit alpha 1